MLVFICKWSVPTTNWPFIQIKHVSIGVRLSLANHHEARKLGRLRKQKFRSRM